MNFLLRQSHSAASIEQPPMVRPFSKIASSVVTTMTFEDLIAEDGKSSQLDNSSEDGRDSFSGENEAMASPTSHNFAPLPDKHVDVKIDEGWIAIPFKEIPNDWDGAPDINRFKSLDRSFVFPGEQVHILACLSASKQDTEIITPFKIPYGINKNGVGQGVNQGSPSEAVSSSESLLRTDDYRNKTHTLLQKFKASHFFVRISEAGEQLWSKRISTYSGELPGEMECMENENIAGSGSYINAAIDNGRFDTRESGGLARNFVKCCSLANGDIVVLLQMNVGVDFLKDPILEILQFERHYDKSLALQSDVSTNLGHNLCGELVKWLLPLDNSHQPVGRSSPSNLASASHKTSLSATNSSPLFSFGHFRSYSMSSIPQNPPPPAPATSPPTSASADSPKPKFDLEDWDRFASQKFMKNTKTGSQDSMSFRGVPLEPEKFSVCCGLEGIYIPGKRWRKNIEIIQPINIHTFAANCNTDDLLCVQIKNVSPAHLSEIVVYIDAITIILEEASKVTPPVALPIACIEAGNNHTLPNLALRRGEEHSFILKPTISALKKSNAKGIPTNMQLPSKAIEDQRNMSSFDDYAVLVSCHCNYSESRLFFKKPTNWRPRISRDLMISVASEMSKQNLDLTGRICQLPVQVLTLQASNLTYENLTFTILAPTSFTPPPSVVSQNLALAPPTGPFIGVPPTQILSSVASLAENKKHASQSLSLDEQAISIADVIPTTALTCTHLWLHSRVPFGCVPSQSTATIKLGLLPLTDGIITLDTLQIYVKEKGVTYIPEHKLKINAISSISPRMI